MSAENMSSSLPDAAVPLGYDEWEVAKVKEWAGRTSDEQREAAIAYESSHKNRKEYLTALGATPAE